MNIRCPASSPVTAGLVALLSLLAPGVAEGQGRAPPRTGDPAGNRGTPAKIELGRSLFGSPLLSEGGRVSCATCHDPEKSFIDGLADSKGRMEIGIGRNSPTLFGIGSLELFRDPAQARFAAPGMEPRTLSLEERCLAPMENELEMGGSPAAAVRALKRIEGLDGDFDRAFGGAGGGVTAARIGRALAAFVRTLDPPRVPYRRWLEGDPATLDPAARRGLAIFEGGGRCAACHSGRALSDGLMHVVDPPDGLRIRDRERAAAERRVALLRLTVRAGGPEALPATDAAGVPIDHHQSREIDARKLPGGGGYDPAQLEVQTTTLWDVARTAPYFRDGAVEDLREAVLRHLAEMAEVRARAAEVDETLRRLARAGKRAPRALRATAPLPPEIAPLDAARLDDLLAFLRSLSPR